MQNNDKIHIGLSFADDFPDTIIEKYISELISENLNIQVRKFPFGGPYASLEWAIPTLVSAYLLKPYFDGFLKEAAKDHYTLLKNWLKNLSKDLRLIKVSTATSTLSSQKINPKNSQSKVFSIETITNQGYSLKFLFDESRSSSDWDIAIENVVKILKDHFTDGEFDDLSIIIKAENLGKVIYAKLKTDQNEWEFLDFKKIYQEIKENNAIRNHIEI